MNVVLTSGPSSLPTKCIELLTSLHLTMVSMKHGAELAAMAKVAAVAASQASE